MTIRSCTPEDIDEMHSIVNDAARAYKGVIPQDRWHEPYMSLDELREEIENGVLFSGYVERGTLLGVMGIQDRGEVSLIRHAYVRTSERNRGIGTMLLHHLEASTTKPILVGTWTAAHWAVAFYEKNGYKLLQRKETEAVLRKYWSIPDRQVVTSVVLANERWKSCGRGAHTDR